MRNIIVYLIVSLVFLSNVLILIFENGRLGFGYLEIALSGVLMTYAGLFLWLWGFISLGSSFALFTKVDKLVKHGAYKYFKHPIYIGIFFTFFGIAVAKGAWLALLFNFFVTSPMNFIRAKNEEKFISKKFASY